MSPGSKNEIHFEISKLKERRPTLELRARILHEFRNCLIEKGFLEVETPYILPEPAPERHIDPIAVEEGYLHTSPEICMKRLFAAGYDRIFQICKCFRRREHGSRHLPEFTMLEWYRAGINYEGLMVDCETLVSEVVKRTKSGYTITYAGEEIDFRPPWQWLSVRDAFDRYAGMDLAPVLREDKFEELLIEKVEPNLGRGRPTFLHDFPASMAAMAKTRVENSEIEERFELYVVGVELANGFSELNDEAEQKTRLEKEMKARKNMGKDIFPLPMKFLQSVGHMPDGAGIALGIDRLVMVLADKQDIKEVVAFAPEEL